ncbi:MAG: hypothetical protein EBX50_16080 [Chitinophagia bacterium]|nr:hypothetical protein [Chitinophagia bacterium]
MSKIPKITTDGTTVSIDVPALEILLSKSIGADPNKLAISRDASVYKDILVSWKAGATELKTSPHRALTLIKEELVALGGITQTEITPEFTTDNSTPTHTHTFVGCTVRPAKPEQFMTKLAMHLTFS